MAELNRAPAPILGQANPILRLGVYGEGGVGKTTLALSFPKPLVIDTDGGLEGDAVVDIEGDEWTPDKWQDLNALYTHIKTRVEGDAYQTIIIDSIDTLCHFLRHEAENIGTAGRRANASETEMITASEQDYGRVSTAVDIFLTKLKNLSKARGVHIVLTSAVRETNPEKGRLKRTFDCQPAVEKNLLYWCNTYGELEVVDISKDKDKPNEHRILHTKVSDRARKNKTRWAALRPAVADPTFTKLVSLIEKGKA
jgi:hypothetical protein